MRLNGIQCDQCAKQHLFPVNIHYIETTSGILPASWVKVEHGRVNAQSAPPEPFLFCGDGCLLSWITSRTQAAQVECVVAVS